jgi:hypothetical protein
MKYVAERGRPGELHRHGKKRTECRKKSLPKNRFPKAKR